MRRCPVRLTDYCRIFVSAVHHRAYAISSGLLPRTKSLSSSQLKASFRLRKNLPWVFPESLSTRCEPEDKDASGDGSATSLAVPSLPSPACGSSARWCCSSVKTRWKSRQDNTNGTCQLLIEADDILQTTYRGIPRERDATGTTSRCEGRETPRRSLNQRSYGEKKLRRMVEAWRAQSERTMLLVAIQTS